jgi:hypothetical protein
MYKQKEDVIKVGSPNFWVYTVSILLILIGIYFYVEYGSLKLAVFSLLGFVGIFLNTGNTLYIDLQSKDLKFIKRGIFTSKTFRYYFDNISEIVLYRKKVEGEDGNYTIMYCVFLITKEREQVSTDGFSDPRFVQINAWNSWRWYSRMIAEKISSALKMPFIEKEKGEEILGAW